MSQNKGKNNNILGLDIDESSKNVEDLLAYNSKYNSNSYREEDIKEKELELRSVKGRLSGESTSFSQKYSNISGSHLKKIIILPKETDSIYSNISFDIYLKNYNDFQEKQRKLSSPLCCYYDGSDIYLSKTQKSIINMNKSFNFIKKKNYFNSDKSITHNIFINNNSSNDNNSNIKTNLNNRNQKFSQIDNDNINSENTGHQNDNEKIELKMNHIPYDKRIQNNNIINNNFFYQNNIQQQIFNTNYINLNNFQHNQFNAINNNINKRKLTYNIDDGIIGNYFNNILNIKVYKFPNEQFFNARQTKKKFNPILFSYNEEQEKLVRFDVNKKLSTKSISNVNKIEKKPFDKRKGDWLCPECHNLNFAFRIVCNRCQLQKPVNIVNKKGK